MTHFKAVQFGAFEKAFRINLMNSLSGFKSPLLLGTRSAQGNENLAIFSNIIHMGSHPPLLGILFRPSANVPRNTLSNILETQTFSINHITQSHLPNAHLTSAKFAKDVDEFELCALEKEYHSGSDTPFLKGSPLQILASLQELIPIAINDTQLLVASVEEIFIDSTLLPANGRVQFAALPTVACSGLNTYYTPNFLAQYPYARPQYTLNDLKQK